MKALRFDKTGDLKYLELVESSMPKPGEGEVLVKVKAAGLNQSDVSNVLGRHPYTTLPRTPGRDFSGVVMEGPAELVGKQVWGTGKELGFARDGTHAEYMVVPAGGIALKPRSLSFSQAASCGVPYTTAWSALERCGVGKGTRLVIVGAAGAVGSAAASLARWRGADIVGAVRRPEQVAIVGARGLRSILLSEENPLAQGVKEHFSGGAEVILDTTGSWLPQSIQALAQSGRVAVIVAPRDGQVNVPVRDLYRRGASIVGINSMLYGTADCVQILTQIGMAFDAGELRAPDRLQERPFEAALEVYAEVNRGSKGKFVFVTRESLTS
ncbi:MAG: oxidoreductase [Betaproteobacteria bacterium RIFCSPLOWO2_02_FULL_64_12]|nr:MAG: oxidoreductase [Betaproteobacteria bacterium RIFCSPLOWO2_02_FULL_64_12]